MPELQWDELDFMQCLEVEPDVEEYGISYAYEVRRNGLVLDLTVWPMESIVALTLRQEQNEHSLVEFALFVHGKIRYINDKRGEYLEFSQCLMAPRRFSYPEVERIWDAAKPNWTVELSIKPQFQIRYRD